MTLHFTTLHLAVYLSEPSIGNPFHAIDNQALIPIDRDSSDNGEPSLHESMLACTSQPIVLLGGNFICFSRVLLLAQFELKLMTI